MGVWAMIGWGALGLLVLAGVAVMFLLHWAMGVFFALFTAGVLWWVFGVLKKKVDAGIKKTAERLRLEYRPHPFRYGAMEGSFLGRPVRVSYEGTRGFGAGGAIALATGSPGWAALDIGSVTKITMRHGLAAAKRELLDSGPPAVVLNKEELVVVLPDITSHPGQIKSALERLAALADERAGGADG